ncbi:hypothetical protein [Helicobacter burdigaliensis]|uniref:hypothetical protein n=1 Tax=Helicobacter burdigaliensis TaxID=2315334 RepID=UPI000EF6CEF6|nr:hypothetical protein [Helicobacter burdigaliensis]
MKKNYWPLGIFMLAMVVVGLIVLTLRMALTNPVEYTMMCGWKPQYVDENINEITIARNSFLQKYNVDFEGKMEPTKEEFRRLFVRLKDKNDKIIQNANVEFFLTRPHTAKEDQNLGMGELVEGLYESKDFSIERLGKWEAQALIKIGKEYICITKEYKVK